MQNALYFVSNCVSIGHNIGGLLLFFVALYSENRSLVSCRITKATYFHRHDLSAETDTGEMQEAEHGSICSLRRPDQDL